MTRRVLRKLRLTQADPDISTKVCKTGPPSTFASAADGVSAGIVRALAASATTFPQKHLVRNSQAVSAETSSSVDGYAFAVTSP